MTQIFEPLFSVKNRSPMSDNNRVEKIIDTYVDEYSQELVLSLLKVVSLPEQGGLGYAVQTFNPKIEFDGWEVNHERKTIYLDTSGIFSSNSIKEMSNSLKEAIETEFIKSRATLFIENRMGNG